MEGAIDRSRSRVAMAAADPTRIARFESLRQSTEVEIEAGVASGQLGLSAIALAATGVGLPRSRRLTPTLQPKDQKARCRRGSAKGRRSPQLAQQSCEAHCASCRWTLGAYSCAKNLSSESGFGKIKRLKEFFNFQHCPGELRKRTFNELVSNINEIIVVEHTGQVSTAPSAKRRYRHPALLFGEFALRRDRHSVPKKLCGVNIASWLPKSTADNKFQMLH